MSNTRTPTIVHKCWSDRGNSDSAQPADFQIPCVNTLSAGCDEFCNNLWRERGQIEETQVERRHWGIHRATPPFTLISKHKSSLHLLTASRVLCGIDQMRDFAALSASSSIFLYLSHYFSLSRPCSCLPRFPYFQKQQLCNFILLVATSPCPSPPPPCSPAWIHLCCSISHFWFVCFSPPYIIYLFLPASTLYLPISRSIFPCSNFSSSFSFASKCPIFSCPLSSISTYCLISIYFLL